MYAEISLNAPAPGPDRCLWLPEPLLEAWSLPLGERIELTYGQRTAEALVGVIGDSRSRRHRYIAIPSSSLAEELGLVSGLEYRIARTGAASITLGPVVGLIVGEGRRRDAAPGPEWEHLMQAYDEIKGLTILFGPDDVDWTSGVVTGRYYDPKHEAGPWIPGRFPIPAAAYRRAPLAAGSETQWLQGTDRRLFNGRLITDRWEIHQALARHDDLAPRLAAAALVTSFGQVREALERAETVWLKPRTGEQSQGAMRIDRTNKGFETTYRSRSTDVRRRFRTIRELRAFLSRQSALGGRYIAQEPVPSATIGGHRFELRLLIQRGGSGEFCCSGRLAKLFAPGSVSDAPEQGVILLPVDLALTSALRISLDEAREVERRAIAWSCDVVARLEEDFSTLGDVSVDIAVGSDGEIWLIGCDLCPDYSLFEGFDKEMYRAGSTMWHRYASFLASFPVPT